MSTCLKVVDTRRVAASRAATFPRPDWVCFDLDPNNGKFADAANAGLFLKEALDALDLVSYPKTSGSRGLHVFVPIRVGPAATQVLKFAEGVVQRLAESHPKQLTVEHSIAARGDRVYLDAFRNGTVQTVVSPFSVRRKPHAPISTPLSWSEVQSSLDPNTFTLGNFRERLRRNDPWSDFFRSRQSLQKAWDRLKQL